MCHFKHKQTRPSSIKCCVSSTRLQIKSHFPSMSVQDGDPNHFHTSQCQPRMKAHHFHTAVCPIRMETPPTSVCQPWMKTHHLHIYMYVSAGWRPKPLPHICMSAQDEDLPLSHICSSVMSEGKIFPAGLYCPMPINQINAMMPWLC